MLLYHMLRNLEYVEGFKLASFTSKIKKAKFTDLSVDKFKDIYEKYLLKSNSLREKRFYSEDLLIDFFKEVSRYSSSTKIKKANSSLTLDNF